MHIMLKSNAFSRRHVVEQLIARRANYLLVKSRISEIRSYIIRSMSKEGDATAITDWRSPLILKNSCKMVWSVCMSRTNRICQKLNLWRRRCVTESLKHKRMIQLNAAARCASCVVSTVLSVRCSANVFLVRTPGDENKLLPPRPSLSWKQRLEPL